MTKCISFFETTLIWWLYICLMILFWSSALSVIFRWTPSNIGLMLSSIVICGFIYACNNNKILRAYSMNDKKMNIRLKHLSQFEMMDDRRENPEFLFVWSHSFITYWNIEPTLILIQLKVLTKYVSVCVLNTTSVAIFIRIELERKEDKCPGALFCWSWNHCCTIYSIRGYSLTLLT